MAMAITPLGPRLPSQALSWTQLVTNYMTLGASNLGPNNLSGNLALTFLFSETDFNNGYDFWSDDVDYLTDMTFLLALVDETDATAQVIDLDPQTNVGEVAWTLAGLTAEFKVVPEPTHDASFRLRTSWHCWYRSQKSIRPEP